ncbi:MAG TPA: DedA family protein [Gemmatimonadaceae bacterium]|nr:DedA family protein [Gemmatimonadaceae bacterium]
MPHWIVSLVHTLGSPGIAVLMLLESIFPPLPSELIMPLAGFVATRRDEPVWAPIIAGTIGSLVGAIAWYAVGRRLGQERFRGLIDRHGRWLALRGRDLDRAARWFERRGGLAVLLGRLIPGVRVFISVPAGFAPMPVVPFLLASAAGTIAWNAALVYAGLLLGEHYDRVARFIGPVSWIALGALLMALAMRGARLARARRAAQALAVRIPAERRARERRSGERRAHPRQAPQRRSGERRSDPDDPRPARAE